MPFLRVLECVVNVAVRSLRIILVVRRGTQLDQLTSDDRRAAHRARIDLRSGLAIRLEAPRGLRVLQRDERGGGVEHLSILGTGDRHPLLC